MLYVRRLPLPVAVIYIKVRGHTFTTRINLVFNRTIIVLGLDWPPRTLLKV